MSWIKDNKFVAALAGGTLLGVILLLFVGTKGRSGYAEARTEFDESFSEVSRFEKMALYPRQDLRDSKKKALDEYRVAAGELQDVFAAYRPEELKNISPQEFTKHLKAVDQELRTAFEEDGVSVPDQFFCGFENYKDSLADENSTGILDYQLSAIQSLMLALSKSGATELKNVYRPVLPEEQGKEYEPTGLDVARALPLEITFSGPPKGLRGFISSIVDSKQRFLVIRSVRISNSKNSPPMASDAQFEKPKDAKADAGDNDVFESIFELPGEAIDDEEEAAEDVVEEEEIADEPASDTSRILYQVLGNESVQVIIRLDVMQFLPAKELP